VSEIKDQGGRKSNLSRQDEKKSQPVSNDKLDKINQKVKDLEQNVDELGDELEEKIDKL
jgi:hypothetical protein